MEFKPDIISITETWIKQSSTGPYKNLEGYQFASNLEKIVMVGEWHFMLKTVLVYLFMSAMTSPS